jgi:anti-anti-sigma factor
MEFETILNGTVLTITLGETLGTNNAPALMDKINGFKGQEITKVVFDATALTYIASSGIRTIIFAKQKLGNNPTIVFKGCSDDIKKIFTMTGLQSYISFE